MHKTVRYWGLDDYSYGFTTKVEAEKYYQRPVDVSENVSHKELHIFDSASQARSYDNKHETQNMTEARAILGSLEPEVIDALAYLLRKAAHHEPHLHE